MAARTLAPVVRYGLIVVLFAAAAGAFDALVLAALSDTIFDLGTGLARAQATAVVVVVLVVCGGGVAGMAATAPLVGREIKDRDRGLQVLLYFGAAMGVPTVWLGPSVLVLVLSFFFGLGVLGGFLFVERRLRGEHLPIPRRAGDHVCPECGSMQVDLAPAIVAASGPPELLCFKCDHRWRENVK